MKDYLQMMIATAIILALIPCVGYVKRTVVSSDSEADSDTVKLLIEDTGEILSLSMQEYIIGAVFAQMPAEFEEEALKAQAVLASTYAERRKIAENENPTEKLDGAYLSNDSSLYQAYFTEEQAKEVYGDEYDEAYEKISSAAEYAENLMLTYDDEPILVAFHGISFGFTESAKTMWGEEIEYLQSVESEVDAKMEECISQNAFTESEMKVLLEEKYSDEELSDSAENWISTASQSQLGTVLQVKIGDGVYDAGEFCEAIGLNSQHFELTYVDGVFEFEVSGCGHLVGMSQYGANSMAQDGKKLRGDFATLFQRYGAG